MENETVDTIFAASVAALVTRTITHPLDTVRINMQIRSSTITQTFGSLIRSAGLYRGFGISLVLSAPATVSYLATYEISKKRMNHILPSVVSVVISATIAEVISGLVWTPMELLKSRLMVSKERTSTSELIKSIYTRQGPRGFFKGYFLTLGVFVPYSITYFSTFEYFQKLHADSTDIPLQYQLMYSTVAGAFACAASHPLEVLKTRWQVLGTTGISMNAFISTIIKREGVKGLFRGLSARILWITPSVALSMSVFKDLMKN